MVKPLLKSGTTGIINNRIVEFENQPCAIDGADCETINHQSKVASNTDERIHQHYCQKLMATKLSIQDMDDVVCIVAWTVMVKAKNVVTSATLAKHLEKCPGAQKSQNTHSEAQAATRLSACGGKSSMPQSR